jgi:cytochrome P450
MTVTAAPTSLALIARRVPAPARRALLIPGVIAFAASPRVRANPYPLYRAMLALEPVYESPFGIWIVAGHSEVSQLLRSPLVSNTEANADLDALQLEGLNKAITHLAFGRRGNGEGDGSVRQPRFFELMSETMLFRDPPDHTRLRSLVNKAFTPRRAEALAPVVHSLLNEMLEPIESRGRMELMGELAYPLPARIICELRNRPPRTSRATWAI